MRWRTSGGALRAMGLRVVAMVAVLGGALVLSSAGANAQDRLVPDDQASLQMSFAPVVKAARPAVVNVYVTRRVREFVSPFANNPFFERFFRHRGGGRGVPRERMANSLGSGVIVSPDGLVITNDHVIKGGGEARIRVALSDRREFDAEVVLRDPDTDLAVLRITPENGEALPFLSFANVDRLEVGDLVLAIGNPFGVGQTVTSGIISALARTRKVGREDSQFFLQTDAAINPGNSGGALVDMQGQLVGINTAIFSRSGGSIGIGFAIPADLVALILKSATGEGGVRRPWFGAKLAKVDRDLAEALGLDRSGGALVERVTRDGPAAQAGIRPGDVILAVDGREVTDPETFDYRFTTRDVGGLVPLTVFRDGRRVTREVTLVETPASERYDGRMLVGRHPLGGVEVATLTNSLMDQFRLTDVEAGAAVMKVSRRSIAARYGLRPGDVIVRINGARVETADAVQAAMEQTPQTWRVVIRRDGRLFRMTVPTRG